jgi:prevent-host-death family protein
MDTQNYTDIAATDLKTHSAEVLRAVENGQYFKITRHGKVVGKLVPVDDDADLQKKLQAIENIKKLRETLRDVKPFTLEEIVEWKNEGRK